MRGDTITATPEQRESRDITTSDATTHREKKGTRHVGHTRVMPAARHPTRHLRIYVWPSARLSKGGRALGI